MASTALYVQGQPPENESATQRAVRDEQLPSLRINAGTVLMRAAARHRLAGEDELAGRRQQHAGNLLTLAFEGIEAQRTDPRRPHQHTINVLPRLAMNEAVDGRIKTSFRLALGAAALGLLSESPSMVERTSGLTAVTRMIAKAKSVGRGLNALGVAITSLPGVRNVKPVRYLRDKMILAPYIGA